MSNYNIPRWSGTVRNRALCLVVALVAVIAPLVTPATAFAASPADPSDVVLLFDFSGSILDDKGTRTSFAKALEKIADRVDETVADLIAGDASISFVQFATEARDYGGCTDLNLHNNRNAVTDLSECLRDIASDYRKGGSRKLTRAIGNDTNYVAAIKRAAKDLPADSARPAVVMFTDGKHDVDGIPVSRVASTHAQLFGNREPFAFLPVGMGLEPKSRTALEAGLQGLTTINKMESCEGQASVEWPDVVFDSPSKAGRAVAFAIQTVTCSFTAEPDPVPAPTPATVQPGLVRSVELAADDGSIRVSWLAPEDEGSSPIEDYEVRCQTGGGDWVGSSEGRSPATTTDVGHLTNGKPYSCQVAAVSAAGVGPWAPSPAGATPMGIPPAPGKPGVDAKDKSALVSVAMAPDAVVSRYLVECSADGGASWPASAESPEITSGILVGGLTNGVDYACRAFAENARGRSDASALSNPFSPCGSLFECYPQAKFVLIGLLGLGLALLLFVIWQWWTNRTRAHVTAIVDDHDIEYLGRGPLVGFTLVKAPSRGPVTGVVADPSPDAHVRVRYLGDDKFEVTSGGITTKASGGRIVEFVDADDDTHSLVLRAMPEYEPGYTTYDDSGDDWSTDLRTTLPSAGFTASDSVWD